jgi:hypothetical protein
MTTRENLRTMIRLRLGDITETPILTDDQINQWIDDSVREYSIHFPRPAELHIVCSESNREYAVNGKIDESGKTVCGARAILKVEYPHGEDPPKFLLRRRELDGRGFYGENVYDVRADPSMSLLIGPLPTGTEMLAIQLTCDHPPLSLDTDRLTLPDRHLELIILFARLLALQELAVTEATDPSPTGVILTGLSTMLARAREDYESKLTEYINNDSTGGLIIGWGGLISI